MSKKRIKVLPIKHGSVVPVGRIIAFCTTYGITMGTDEQNRMFIYSIETDTMEEKWIWHGEALKVRMKENQEKAKKLRAAVKAERKLAAASMTSLRAKSVPTNKVKK